MVQFEFVKDELQNRYYYEGEKHTNRCIHYEIAKIPLWCERSEMGVVTRDRHLLRIFCLTPQRVLNSLHGQRLMQLLAFQRLVPKWSTFSLAPPNIV